MFNSWDLAAAGYNAGEGKVMKAMKIARSDDFWEISKYRFLKQETKKYVPMFLAAVTIAKEPQKYGFDNIEYHPPLVYEKVTVPPSTSFASIAKAAETDLSEIRSLNPALIREKTPPNSPSFDIKLPMGKKDVFERNFPRLSHPSGKNSQHRVCSGETLARVAKKYHVSLQDLCSANEISPQTTIKPGSILKIPQ
jgi:membrane-bound lytic murein transglycosylase D